MFSDSGWGNFMEIKGTLVRVRMDDGRFVSFDHSKNPIGRKLICTPIGVQLCPLHGDRVFLWKIYESRKNVWVARATTHEDVYHICEIFKNNEQQLAQYVKISPDGDRCWWGHIGEYFEVPGMDKPLRIEINRLRSFAAQMVTPSMLTDSLEVNDLGNLMKTLYLFGLLPDDLIPAKFVEYVIQKITPPDWQPPAWLNFED